MIFFFFFYQIWLNKFLRNISILKLKLQSLNHVKMMNFLWSQQLKIQLMFKHRFLKNFLTSFNFFFLFNFFFFNLKVSEVLNVPRSKIVVQTKRLGGGFGGKEIRANFIASALAVAAQKVWLLFSSINIIFNFWYYNLASSSS